MASLANQMQKVLRYHVPLIRFKYGVNQSDSTFHISKENKSESNTAKMTGAPSPTTQSKSGKKSAPLEFSETPKKYRRRPLTQDEIDLVAIGGYT